jgi:chromosome segregation ATPase
MKITTRQYVNRETWWQEKVDNLSDKLLSAEAKLRESEIRSETKLRESEIASLREAIKVFTQNLKEYKESANEWRDQLKDERSTYTKTTEHDKDIVSVRQMINEVNKTLDNKTESLSKEMRTGTEHLSAEIKTLSGIINVNSGRDKVMTIIISMASSLVIGLIIGIVIYFINKK